MKYKILFFIVVLAMLNCSNKSVRHGNAPLKEEDVLISQKFLDDNSYLIVCRGFPKEDLEGMARSLSAEKSAQLNAMYFTQKVFNDDLDPVKFGTVEKYVKYDDHVVIHYLIRKEGLKNSLRE